jgi:Associated with zinc fingers
MPDMPIIPDDKDVIIEKQNLLIDKLTSDLAEMHKKHDVLQAQLTRVIALLEGQKSKIMPPPPPSVNPRDPRNRSAERRSGPRPQTTTHMDVDASPSRKRKQESSPQDIDDKTPFEDVKSKKEKRKTKTSPPATKTTPAPQEQTLPQQPPASQEPSEKLPPPVIIHNSQKWTAISSRFKADGLNFTKASLTRNGVRIQPATSNDFRKITKFLENSREPYHSFCSEEERAKSIQVAIRGIPIGTTNEEIAEDLIEKGFTPSDVFRMISAKTKKPIPIIKARLPASQKSVYEIRQLCHISVVVEPLNIKPQVPQCHRCQKFWHTKNFCHGHHRCVKCGQLHDSATCEKSKGTPAKCANCEGDHTASYRGCPAFPKLPKKPSPQQRPQSKPTTPGVSYAQATKPRNLQPQAATNPQSPPPITPQNFGAFFNQLTQMHARMQQFQAQNPLFFSGFQA